MATDLGKVGMVLKGAWSSSATYEVMDAVSYNNGLYIAKQAVPANTAPTNTTYWQVAISGANIMPQIDSFIAPKNGTITLGISGAGYTLGGSKVYLIFNTSNVSGLIGIVRTNANNVTGYVDLMNSVGLSAVMGSGVVTITNSTNYDLTVVIYRMT